MHRPFRKPLILMTPKSLLRHKKCTSFLADFGPGSSFHRVLRDQAESVPGAWTTKLAEDREIRRVILCSGKVYFDLMEARDKLNESGVYILRLEQLYSLSGRPAGTGAEPLPPRPTSSGARRSRRTRAPGPSCGPASSRTIAQLGGTGSPRYVGRPEYASTAAGLMSQHNAELKTFLAEALTL
ncbi:MAG: hypothetical protein WDM81_12055 [Rhizomicrobium sp.]